MQTNINVLYNKHGGKKLHLLLGVFLPVICCLNAFAGKGDTQSTLDKKISGDFKNMTLKEAVAKLENCIPGVSFTYVESGMMNEGRVNILATDEKASEVLDKILSPFSFSYTVMQYHVVIWYDVEKAAKLKTSSVNRLPKTTRITLITGLVVDLKMKPLSGVAILVSGGAKSGVCDSFGGFTLHNIASTAILVFTAKRYKAQRVYASAAAEGFLLVQLAKGDSTMQQAPLH